MEVVKSGKPIHAEQWTINGTTQIAFRVPIISKGKVIGAAGFSVFRDMEEAKFFASKISMFNSSLVYYTEAVKKLSLGHQSLDSIIGNSPGILEAKERALKVADTNLPVLIYGETGTGKELFAHAIHEESTRRDGPLISVNCAGIPESLMESEFFGYDEGAFTGARKGGKPGKFEMAHQGSLFLDEINDLPYSTQSKLLRVLQEMEFERVGGIETKKVDVRLISATNADLRDLIEKGSFRQDLFYRLNAFFIRIPPLRERMEDFPLLAKHFINSYNYINGTDIYGISKEALEFLSGYHWPGNVREFKIAIERACLDTRSGIIELENLVRFGGRNTREKSSLRQGFTLKEACEYAEKRAIIKALEISRGNKKKAAEILGIHRTSLYDKMHQYGITTEENGPRAYLGTFRKQF
jgi:transcriptional regulator with PAS, ATPase and Fis domain